MGSLFRYIKYFSILGTLVVLTGFDLIDNHPAFHDYRDYILKPSSVLSINGETNVNSFCCSSQQKFPKGRVGYEWGKGNGKLNFKNTQLKINVQSLDCGANAINKDLQKTLQAESFPYITIELKEALNTDGGNSIKKNQWVEFLAKTEITLCCVTKEVTIPVVIRKSADNRFQIIGSTILQFRDFELEPPTVMMGLIKVKETLDISFDLDAVLI
ncbi:MAG: YceI family protein [Bacteroidetes bacterium]|nr:MAG: YceI family protein [Bacteroidota bacterium]